MIPPKDQLVICFAHAAYQMKACFDALNTGIASFEVRERDAFERRAAAADVIVVSGMWHNGLIPLATRLRFIQSIGSGTDQFDKAELAAETGDLMFALVNLARHVDADPETALRGANVKFERRFAYIERALAARGRSLEAASLSEMDALWNEAKATEKR